MIRLFKPGRVFLLILDGEHAGVCGLRKAGPRLSLCNGLLHKFRSVEGSLSCFGSEVLLSEVFSEEKSF